MRFTRERTCSELDARKGFTLLELLVVVAIIAILASFIAPSIFRNVGDAKIATARTQIETFSLALNAYRIDNDVYPSTEQGLAALRIVPVAGTPAPNWRGPYLTKNVGNDPWGHPYIYESPGKENPGSFDIISLGRDGMVGGDGEDSDITSWMATR